MKPQDRYKKLEQHLSEENPLLLNVIKNYKELDIIGYKAGLLTKDETYASQISWWPLISILGTFSAGKSSFINQYTNNNVQTSGNQAVDEKFTVICFGNGDEVHTLPGLALDADPRFPFFGIAEEIDKVDQGEGNKIDHYLQLKTVPEEILKGKILIDSPGFDADAQRDSTLKLTDHIIDMSDLVLVFFDARHPEPGAMRDTLHHLVKTHLNRKDGDKILYILNQIDTAAQEDNPEEVISAWQRALSQQGLISGNFYTIYNEKLAVPIADSSLAERFKRKKDMDLERILDRMNKVSIERAYRITHMAETLANEIRDQKIPQIETAIKRWRKKVILTDIIIIGAFLFGLDWLYWSNHDNLTSFNEWLSNDWQHGAIISGILLAIVFGIHYFLRNKFCHYDARKLETEQPDIANALRYNNRFWRGMFSQHVRGWGRRNQKRLVSIVQSSKQAIQSLTDQFANPSGQSISHSSNKTEISQEPDENQETPEEDIENLSKAEAKVFEQIDNSGSNR
ncbi:dynamin family protein [Thiomicrorhabdus sp.]|uniref:dynamin family protein n=1 Tax=Thiomicrorhabdus sp. TaxID=2039724 RepID=UPI00356A2671